jgi:hypothetical protein
MVTFGIDPLLKSIRLAAECTVPVLFGVWHPAYRPSDEDYVYVCPSTDSLDSLADDPTLAVLWRTVKSANVKGAFRCE